MKVSSRQVMDRTGMAPTQLLRLRDVLGIDVGGTGTRPKYGTRTADVFVTLWTLMQNLHEINKGAASATRPHGLTRVAYRQIGKQLLDSPVAVLESGVVEIRVRLIETDWSVDHATRSSGTR